MANTPNGMCLAGTHLLKVIWTDHFLFMICLELRPEVKVTVTQKQNMTLCGPKVYPHTEFQIPTPKNVGYILPTGFC